MVSDNQANLTMPLGIIQRLDKFIETDLADQMGVTSRPQAVIMLLREFLDKYAPVKIQELEEGKITLLTTTNNKIILEDSLKGPIIVEIDKDEKLQCYPCLDDPHNNRYITFVSEQKELWPFLKKNGVKYLVVRDNGNTKEIKI